MNRILKYALCLLLPVIASAQYIPVSVRLQAKLNWDWAAIIQSVLDYYGKYPSQHKIATWATPGQENTGILLFGSLPSAAGIDAILTQFAGLTTVAYNRVLTKAEVTTELAAGHIIIAQKASGKFIIHGISGDYLNVISPWPTQGAMVQTYTSFLDASGYMWFQTLVVTTPKPTTLPARPIVEADVPRGYAAYAFDQATVNNYAIAYANPTTTTTYANVGSGWQQSLPNLYYTYGMTLGSAAKVGSVYSSGPVYMKTNSVINGSLYMKDLTQLTKETGATITSNSYNVNPSYGGFGWGTIDFTGVAQTTVTIPPNSARTFLAPGKYWNYTIQSGSPIQLSPGDYFFNNLTCDVCSFEINAATGPVRIYVANSLGWNGTQTFVGGTAARLMTAVLGNTNVNMTGVLNGTVLVPNATLSIGQTAKNYTGAYIAKNVVLHQNTKLRYQMFSFE